MKTCEIPGFSSMVEFAHKHNMLSGTVQNHMRAGKCKWPRVRKAGNKVHPLYTTWESMKSRCNNPNRVNYKHYGGRGIKVCDSWTICFWQFVEDMGEKPSPQHTLDRIDNNGNYEPDNCRWATVEEQRLNTRRPLGCLHYRKGDKRWVVKWKGVHIKSFKDKTKAEQVLNKLRKDYYGK